MPEHCDSVLILKAVIFALVQLHMYRKLIFKLTDFLTLRVACILLAFNSLSPPPRVPFLGLDNISPAKMQNLPRQEFTAVSWLYSAKVCTADYWTSCTISLLEWKFTVVSHLEERTKANLLEQWFKDWTLKGGERNKPPTTSSSKWSGSCENQ